MTRIMQQLLRVFTSLPKYQNKKYKNRRSVAMSLLTSSQIMLRYGNNPEKANDLIKQYYNIKTDDIVYINLYNDRVATEKN